MAEIAASENKALGFAWRHAMALEQELRGEPERVQAHVRGLLRALKEMRSGGVNKG